MTSLFSVLARRVEFGETSVKDALSFVRNQKAEFDEHIDDPRVRTVYEQNKDFIRDVLRACMIRSGWDETCQRVIYRASGS